MSIVLIENAQNYKPRPLRYEEAISKFGFCHFFHVPNQDFIQNKINEQGFDKAISGLVTPFFSPEQRIISPDHTRNGRNFHEIDNDFVIDHLVYQIQKSVGAEYYNIRQDNSFFKLKTDPQLSRKMKELKAFVTEYGNTINPKNSDKLFKMIEKANPVTNDESERHICNIPDIDFLNLKIFSVESASLGDIKDGKPLFSINEYKFNVLEFEDLNENANMTLYFSLNRYKENEKTATLHLQFTDNGYQFFYKKSDKEVFFENLDNVKQFIDEMKTKITNSKELFNF